MSTPQDGYTSEEIQQHQQDYGAHHISTGQELEILLRENEIDSFFELSGIDRNMPETDELGTMIYLAQTVGTLVIVLACRPNVSM